MPTLISPPPCAGAGPADVRARRAQHDHAGRLQVGDERARVAGLRLVDDGRVRSRTSKLIA